MPVKQHPVPQHIASYEFKLVGEMTLKQFGYLAGGLVLAFFFYATSLPFYFKWPAVIGFAVLGVALAFFPFQERPLSVWLVAFFKAAFRPTLFTWQKQQHYPAFLTYLPQKDIKMAQLRSKQAAPKGQADLSGYLQSLPRDHISPLDEIEKNQLAQIGRLFDPNTVVEPPKPKPLVPPTTTATSTTNPQNDFAPGFSPNVFKPLSQPEKRPETNQSQTVDATINTKLPIPKTPSQPNILTGMVADKRGNLVEGAILEIRNEQGIPIRALKTNQLGQFLIVTPLQNGVYEIETEKEALSFAIIKIEAKGEIIPPIEIRAEN